MKMKKTVIIVPDLFDDQRLGFKAGARFKKGDVVKWNAPFKCVCALDQAGMKVIDCYRLRLQLHNVSRAVWAVDVKRPACPALMQATCMPANRNAFWIQWLGKNKNSFVSTCNGAARIYRGWDPRWFVKV
jgi:hypothetical protein